MRTSTIALSAAALAGVSSATPGVKLIVEASHGGAGNGLTNTTVVIPLGPVFHNSKYLNTVSTLYITDASVVDVNTVTCQVFKSTDGSGSPVNSFTAAKPARLSTNTVQVGSIVCSSSAGNGTSSTSTKSGYAISAPTPSTTSNIICSKASSNIVCSTKILSTGVSTPTPSSGGSLGGHNSTTLGYSITPTPSASSTTGPSGATATPSGPATAAAVTTGPYLVSALLFGAASLFFTL